ncbi:MAG: dienelactone hydrolase, partial [Cyanobacteria bacterium J06632_22]
PVDLYFPRDLAAGPIPVMVFSHGYGDTRTNPGFVALARSLAAHGFLVALPEHIGSNTAYQEDLALGLVDESFQATAFINRPLDISILLDTLEQHNAADFQGRLQLERVGLLGHSFGGYTAFATAGATVDLVHLQEQCVLDDEITPEEINLALLLQCRVLELSDDPAMLQMLTDGSLADDRVGLVMVMAPVTNLFGESGMARLQMPVVIMGGAYDIAAPVVPEQLNAFRGLTTDAKYFYLAENTSHTPELTGTVLRLLHPGNDAARSSEESSQWLQGIAHTLMIAHGKTHLLGEDSYLPYLRSAYVGTVSVEPARVHLIRALPPEDLESLEE